MKAATAAALIATFVLFGAGLSLSAGFTEEAARTTATDAATRDGYRRTQDIPFPEDNPYSEAKNALGKALFFDPILSGSRTTSCASCHNPNLAWGDGRARAVGDKKSRLSLRSPTLIDVAGIAPLGWDGKFPSLEAVPFGPILNEANMDLTEAELVHRLSDSKGYVALFSRAFDGGKIDRHNVELALATFQRTITSGEAPFDRWIAGDERAITASAKRGFDIFNGKANCAACHNGPSFTDGSFHDIGTAEKDDFGRGRLFPSSRMLRYAFKTPTLRDVARRGPYMHDGSIGSLNEVIALYDKGGIERPSRSPEIKPLSLTETDKADLIAFLDTLTSSAVPMAAPELPR